VDGFQALRGVGAAFPRKDGSTILNGAGVYRRKDEERIRRRLAVEWS